MDNLSEINVLLIISKDNHVTVSIKKGGRTLI